jgi:hypothetical protein
MFEIPLSQLREGRGYRTSMIRVAEVNCIHIYINLALRIKKFCLPKNLFIHVHKIHFNTFIFCMIRKAFKGIIQWLLNRREMGFFLI